LADGTRVDVGTGFSDAERDNPPPIGSIIAFRYQELSDGGVPRFPSYVGMREDVALLAKPQAAVVPPPETAMAAKRYFECVAGASSKFWEISVTGSDMTTRWGRIGSAGQSKTKSFKDEAAAQAQAEKLIAEKTGDGYLEKTLG
jgi:DNA ligase-1